jgi:hypothetical protein
MIMSRVIFVTAKADVVSFYRLISFQCRFMQFGAEPVST